MKKILLAITLSCFALSGYANLNGNGYYRVKNFGSSRWGTLVDNKASVDFFAGSADLHSLELTNNTEEILSDPGSVIYINQKSNNQYDLAGQGVTLEGLVNQNISVRENGTGEDGQKLYMVYGTYKGVSKYIGDSEIILSREYGNASLNVSDPNFNKWYILPVDPTSANYFGAVPDVKAGDKLYTTLFTSFAYNPYSEGVKAYYIDRVGYGMAEMVEITGAVPPGSPVVIECAGENVSDNRMELKEIQDVLPANALTGVYFNFTSKSFVNQVAYDPETMRILGVCKDGSLGFVTSDIDFIPANTAYLKVAPGSAPELKCVSTTEYMDNLPEAPESFYLNTEDYPLLAQGDETYSGTFQIPAPEDSNDLSIKFFASSNAEVGYTFLGAYGANVNIESNGTTSVPFTYESPYNWIIPNWTGGSLTVTINLQSQNITFNAEMAGVDSIIANDDSLVYNGVEVYCNSASSINVYNLSGQLMISSKGQSVDVSGLPKGVYTAVANGKSIKIVR